MSIEEIKKILMRYYDLDADELEKGCYINGKWFSIDAIIEILKRCY